MVATISGTLALLVGLAVLLLPLLAVEMSRPRDGFWGAVVLLLGLTLVTSADRLSGSPMLAVLCGGLLIGRLGSEVLLLRWRQLSGEEQQRLVSLERWQTSLTELAATSAKLIAAVLASGSSLLAAFRGGSKRSGSGSSGKRWVRQEPTGDATPPTEHPQSPGATEADATLVVQSFAEIDQLLQAASPQAG